jgi:hypothetical protein
MQPDLIVGLIKQKQPPLDILQKRFKSDVQWRLDEQSPLGKAEWIKFLVLYTDSIPRHSVFSEIEKNTTLLWF